MQARIDCFYCYFKQIANCMDIAGIEEDRQYQIFFDLMDDIKKWTVTGRPQKTQQKC